MSADSQSTNDSYSTPTRKIFKTSKYIIGFAGDETAGAKFVSWFNNKDNDKPDINEFEAIVLYPDGKMEYWDDNMFPVPILAKYYAIGSGATVALGALYHGHTTHEALLAAKEHDTGTGGKIETKSFRKVKKRQDNDKQA